MKPTIVALVAVTAALTSTPVVAATQIVNADGILKGATGVIVDGISYDVTLVGGTCKAAFSGCVPDHYDFHTGLTAIAAVEALYDQVFIDTSLGNFRSDVTKILGCSDGYFCRSLVVYDYFNHGSLAQQVVFGAKAGSGITNGVSLTILLTDDSVDESNMGNFARFTVSAEQSVPEPATWVMMVGGFGLLGRAMRYRRRASLRFT